MKCTYRDSIFETDQFYLSSLHFISAVQVPLHILGTYIILTKTPDKMGKIKNSMLFLHLCGAWFDLFVSILSSPVFLFPINSGYALGVMYYIMPTWMLCLTGFSSFFLLLISVAMFFENRYNYLVRNDSETHSRKMKRSIHYTFNLISLTCLLPPFWNTKEIPGFREMAHQKLPCLPSNIINNPRLYMLDSNITLILVCVSFFFMIIFSQCIIFFGLTASYIINAHTVSQRTIRIQKQFFKALCTQIGVPFLIIFIPSVCLVYILATGDMDIMLCNGAMIWLSTHGLFSTIVMLRVHEPYRNATMDIMKFRKIEMRNPFTVVMRPPSSIYN